MKILVDQNLKDLALKLNKPLYIVGGFVRNFLLNGDCSTDIDICSPITTDEIVSVSKTLGFTVKAEYKRTGTAVISRNGKKYEFTSFRTDFYDGGNHKPKSVFYTDDIMLDAKRRDFKCNAVYYDIKEDKFVDPLNGISDIKNKVLDTVKAPDEVFGFDGLRLLRLARFAGELGFTPKNEVINSLKRNADKIKEISAERIFDELKKILVADTKYRFSPKDGHFKALKILDDGKVIDYILPEIASGREMAQRSDFHKYDVLNHSLRCVLYSDKSIRLSALLHDSGKPCAMRLNGRYKGHDILGEKIAVDILKRLKCDKKTVSECAFLVKYHMLDIKCDTPVKDLRIFFVENIKYIEKLLMLISADEKAYKDDLVESERLKKLRRVFFDLRSDGTPLSIKELSLSASDLISLGIEKSKIGKTQKYLLDKCVGDNILNIKENLLRLLLKKGLIKAEN